MSEPTLPPEIEELLTHQGWVRRLCRHLAANEVEADEIEQETWRRAIESPPRHRKNLKAWFSAVVRSALVHRVREERGSATRSKTVVSMDRMASEPALESSEQPDSTAERRETFEVLQRLVAELEDPYGDVIFLRYIEAQPPRRIAKKLGIPLRTVQSRLYRGLQLLRRRVHARYGADWRNRCMVFVPSLPSVAATTLTTTLAMSKPIKLTLAAAAVLLAVPMYSVLTDSNDVEPDPVQEATAASFPQDATQGEFAEAPSAPDLQRVPSPSAGDARLRVRVRDDEGSGVSDFQMEIFRDGKQFGPLGGQGTDFTWPIHGNKAGLVFVRARGRAPHWEWFDPKLSQEIVLPKGRELTLRNIAGDDPTAFLDQVGFDFSQLAPTADSELVRYREHWDRKESNPFHFYTNVSRAEVRDGRARFWGIPEGLGGELELTLNTAQWTGAEQERDRWKMSVSSELKPLDVSIHAWPSWTLQVQHPLNPEFPEQRSAASLRLDQDPDIRTLLGKREVDPQNPLLETITIPKTVRLPTPDRVDGWSANLNINWKGAEHRFPILLPLEPCDLGRLIIPNPETFEIQVVDSHGAPIPNAEVRATDNRFGGGVTDENGILVYDSLAGPEIRRSPPVLNLFARVDGFLPSVQTVALLDQSPAKMVLDSAHGILVKFRIFEGESKNQAKHSATVVLRCIGDEQRRPGGLFGRDLSRDEVRRLAPNWGGSSGGKGEDLWGVEIEPGRGIWPGSDLDNEPHNWEARVHDLDPTHPVLLQVIAMGVELYREEFDPWPTGQLVERDLELRLPESVQVRGSVLGGDGKRLKNVIVKLLLPEEQQLDARTDEFGEFDFGKVYSEDLQVSAKSIYGDYLELLPIDVHANEEGLIELRLEMQRAQPIQIHVVHDDGSPFAGDDIDAKVTDGGPWLMAGRNRIKPGVFEIQAPPTGAIDAWVYFEQWTHRETFEMGQEPYVIHIPDHVDMQLQLPEGIGPGGRRTLLWCDERAENGSWAAFDLYGSEHNPPSEDGTFQERPSLPPGEYRAKLQQVVDGFRVTIGEVIDFDVLPATPVTLDFRSAKPIPPEN